MRRIVGKSEAEPRFLEVGDPAIPVALRRSARARRLTLRVAAGTGQASVTAPTRVKLHEIERFLVNQITWLRDRLADQPGLTRVGPGMAIPFRGSPLHLEEGTGRRIERRGDRLFLPRGAHAGSKIKSWLREEARIALAAACDGYQAAIDARPTRITLRDTRSRWGSCTSQGALMFSWRLILAPPAVLDYVALHEMAHLREMNHSADFWKLVADEMPDYATHRAWLKRNGADLLSYDFDS